METQILNIPVAEKVKATNSQAKVAATSCCAPKETESVCCTPGQSKDENNGACCAQPEDGSACCDK